MWGVPPASGVLAQSAGMVAEWTGQSQESCWVGLPGDKWVGELPLGWGNRLCFHRIFSLPYWGRRSQGC